MTDLLKARHGETVPLALHPSRGNVKRERERNVTHLFAGQSAPAQR